MASEQETTPALLLIRPVGYIALSTPTDRADMLAPGCESEFAASGRG